MLEPQEKISEQISQAWRLLELGYDSARSERVAQPVMRLPKNESPKSEELTPLIKWVASLSDGDVENDEKTKSTSSDDTTEENGGHG